jgi:(p)ppGpp synthase/HD superfamily hydrolase
MDHFEQAYTFIKASFQKDKRESGDRTFEHPKGVMEIVLRELPNPNIKKIILALLHDIQETFPEYADVVRKFYGDYMAESVNELSKKDWRLYLSQSEKKFCKKELAQQKMLFHEVRHVLITKHPDKAFTSADKILESEIIEAMNEEQLERYKKLEEKIKPYMDVAKKRRDDDYFGHLNQLDDNRLDVKFADRIHNLRDDS